MKSVLDACDRAQALRSDHCDGVSDCALAASCTCRVWAAEREQELAAGRAMSQEAYIVLEQHISPDFPGTVSRRSLWTQENNVKVANRVSKPPPASRAVCPDRNVLREISNASTTETCSGHCLLDMVHQWRDPCGLSA